MSFIRLVDEDTQRITRFYVIEKDGKLKIESSNMEKAASLEGYTHNGWTVLCVFDRDKAIKILLQAQADQLRHHAMSTSASVALSKAKQES